MNSSKKGGIMKEMKMKTVKVIVAILLLLIGFGVIISPMTAMKIRRIKTENSELIEQISRLTQIVEEKDKKIKGDRELYTSLAGRLHQEMKKVEELGKKLKKGKKRK